MNSSEHTSSFGYWLRRHRKAHDLTQEQLAAIAGCSRAMLRKIECDERRPSALLASRIADALGLAIADRAAFLAVARRAVAVDRLPLPSAPADDLAPFATDARLPAPYTALRGRERACAQLVALVPTTHCVTLCGPGGIGKSRLAIAVAEALAADFPDGIWFIALAPVRQPELLVPTIALSLGLRGDAPAEQQIRHRLWQRRALVVLDNAEHLLDAAADLARILAIPGPRFIVTSRAPLRIAAEHVFTVQPLALADAIALFRERYLAAQPGYTLATSDQQIIAQIVARLDGLPLAIELAAARGRMLTPASIHDRLDDRIALLADGPRDLPPRQRTLRGVVLSSYDLLPARAQQSFARLAVFLGGFDLDAATSIDPSQTTLAELALLLDYHLIVRPNPQRDRFAMLETIAEVACEILQTGGDDRRVRAQHASWFVGFATRAERGLCGADRRIWMDRIAEEVHNIRAALAWMIDASNDPETGLLLASRLRQFWHVRGLHEEGRAWLARGRARCETDHTPAGAHARFADGYLAWFQRDYHAAHRLLVAGVAALRAADEPLVFVEALALLAISTRGENPRQARALIVEATQIAVDLGDPWALGTVHFWRGVIAADMGDAAAAAQFAEASIAAFAESGDRWNSGPHTILGDLAIARGDDTTAQQQFAAALTGFRAIGDIWGCALSLRSLAQIALRAGDYTNAARLAHESLALWHALGDRQAQQRVVRLLAEIRSYTDEQ